MCTGSLDTLTFNWMETQVYPFPDFDVRRQCRNFDTIVEWQKKHSANPDAVNEGGWMGKNFTRPGGEEGRGQEWREIQVPEEYWVVMGKDRTEIHV